MTTEPITVSPTTLPPITVSPIATVNPAIVDIAQRLKANIEQPSAANLTLNECELVCRSSKGAFLEENTILDVFAPVVIVGDVHGQYQDLLRIFKHLGELDNPSKKYLFLGDYVDRGKHSIETITLLLAYKCMYKSRILLLRGNHETRMINTEYGFRQDIKDRGFPDTLWELYNSVFDCMPLCAIVASAKHRIFCTHGGLSEVLLQFPKNNLAGKLRAIKRPLEIPDFGLFCDLLWADPVPAIRGFENNNRGISVYFGSEAIENFCQHHNISFIVRAHQVKEPGYEWFSDRLMTIFSAPKYAGEYRNAGAVLVVDGMGQKINIRTL